MTSDHEFSEHAAINIFLIISCTVNKLISLEPYVIKFI